MIPAEYFANWAPSHLMEWAKSGYSGGRYNLARSGIPAIANLDDLPGGPFKPDIWGHNEWGHEGLKETIAGLYAMRRENILIAQGASQCNMLMAGSILAEGGTAIVETPIYEPILRSVEMWADEIRKLPRRKETRYQPDPDDLRSLLDDKTRLVVLTNLHNPTHVAIEPDRLSAIVNHAAKVGALVVVDEVFMPMYHPDYRGHASAFGAVSINSLGKSWGLDGLRVGWAVGPTDSIYRAYRLNNLFGVNQPFISEDLAFRVLNQPAAVNYMLERRAKAMNGRLLFDRFIEKTTGIRCQLPDGGISALVDLPAGTDDRLFSAELLKKYDTVVFPGSYFDCPGTIRVSFGADANDIQEGLNRLSSYLGECQ